LDSTIEEWLMKKYEGVLYKIARERKEDLKMVFACERSFFYNN
jgi:DNA polymerase epsilon subunit 1